jgi:hypothetical protein
VYRICYQFLLSNVNVGTRCSRGPKDCAVYKKASQEGLCSVELVS